MGGMDVQFLDYLKNLGIEFVKFNDMGHSPLGKAAFKGFFFEISSRELYFLDSTFSN